MFKKILIYLMIFSLLCVTISCKREKKVEGPDASLARFIFLWGQGDYSGMYNYVSAESKATWDEATFVNRYSNISSGIGLTEVKLIQATLVEDEIQYTLEFQTSTVGDFRLDYSIPVVGKDNHWQLDWNHCHIFPDLKSEFVVRVSRQMPRRGSILDRNLLPLAATGTVYNVGLVPGKMHEETVSILSELLIMPASDIVKLLSQKWVREDTFVPVKTISMQTWTQLREPLSSLKGVTAREASSRIYDIPNSLSQTVGYVAEVEAGRLNELSSLGFMAGDIVGQAGLELVHDRTLAGKPGFTITIQDRDSNIIKVVAERKPIDGEDVITTLDLVKNRVMDTALGSRKGSILLMDYVKGDIIGAVSKPGFDSNLFALGITPAQYQELKQLDAPFFNRAFNGLYPPGSVFKPFTALMALEQGVVDPDYSWDTPRQWQKSATWGTYFVTRVVRPLGPVDLWEAMKWSDNVYFADLGLKVGWESFKTYGKALGFGAPVPFSQNREQSQINNGGGGEVLLADSSYGQGEMLATPLHVALMYASLARHDGSMPTPRLSVSDPEKTWLSTGFSSDNIDLVDRVLAYAASDKAALAWVGNETIRGKTGTSEINQDRQIAWYICYFDNLIMVVTIEGDRSLSSTHAVGIARDCLNNGIRN